MASEKVVTYTAEQTKALVEGYVEGKKTVETLATEFGKSVRSIVAKLSKEKVYVPKTKAKGEARVTKAELVDQIAASLGVPAERMESLEKATSEVLDLVAKALVEKQAE